MSYDALKAKLRGVAFTTSTPFSKDGEDVVYDEIKQNVSAVATAGGEVFIPCGNTGEYYSLTDNERINVVGATVDALDSDCVVVGGINGNTKEAITLAKRYEKVGADAVMIMPPDHTYLHKQGIREYYQRIIDAVDSGVVLYKRGPELPMDVIAELSSEDRVVAVKYAVNDIKSFSQAVERVSDEIVWVNGIAERFTPAYALEGAEGFTTGIGNFVPNAVLELMTAIREENWKHAKSIREVLRPYEDLRDEAGENNTISGANNVPAVKYGMELADLYGGPVREPLIELSNADKQRASKYYDNIQAAVIESTTPD